MAGKGDKNRVRDFTSFKSGWDLAFAKTKAYFFTTSVAHNIFGVILTNNGTEILKRTYAQNSDDSPLFENAIVPHGDDDFNTFFTKFKEQLVDVGYIIVEKDLEVETTKPFLHQISLE